MVSSEMVPPLLDGASHVPAKCILENTMRASAAAQEKLARLRM